MSKRLYKHVGWAVLVSELSHVFCCVIPTLVTVLSAFANIGLVVVAPDGILMRIHEALHEYEIPVIVFSGVMVVVGWIAHLASRTVDCHDTGCGHPPCTPRKNWNSRILLGATLLFMVNMVIYFGVHRNVLHLDMFAVQAEEAEHHHDHSEDHSGSAR